MDIQRIILHKRRILDEVDFYKFWVYFNVAILRASDSLFLVALLSCRRAYKWDVCVSTLNLSTIANLLNTV